MSTPITPESGDQILDRAGEVLQAAQALGLADFAEERRRIDFELGQLVDYALRDPEWHALRAEDLQERARRLRAAVDDVLDRAARGWSMAAGVEAVADLVRRAAPDV